MGTVAYSVSTPGTVNPKLRCFRQNRSRSLKQNSHRPQLARKESDAYPIAALQTFHSRPIFSTRPIPRGPESGVDRKFLQAGQRRCRNGRPRTPPSAAAPRPCPAPVWGPAGLARVPAAPSPARPAFERPSSYTLSSQGDPMETLAPRLTYQPRGFTVRRQRPARPDHGAYTAGDLHQRSRRTGVSRGCLRGDELYFARDLRPSSKGSAARRLPRHPRCGMQP